MNDSLGMKQYLVPYLMSSHPGSTLKEAIELAEYLRDLGYMPEQVQDFYPTPSTPVCITRDMIRARWKKCTCQPTRMRKRCSVR